MKGSVEEGTVIRLNKANCIKRSRYYFNHTKTEIETAPNHKLGNSLVQPPLPPFLVCSLLDRIMAENTFP